MLPLIGILNDYDLKLKSFIGVLLFKEYPSTVVYADNEDNPIIKEWVDCSDDGKENRFFYFKTTKYFLKQFINGKIGHQDLILNSTDGFLYFEDTISNSITKKWIINTKTLPCEYMPQSDVYFDKEDGVDFVTIYDYFDLNNAEEPENAFIKIKGIAETRNTEIFSLHLDKGVGVGYGSVNTDILGKTLVKFDKLYKDIVFDHYLGKNRGTIKQKKDKGKELEINEYAQTEVFLQMAASYLVLIRPKNSQFDAFQNTTNSEIIANKIFKLIENSNDEEKLKTEYIEHSDNVVNSYKEFLKDITELELNLKLDWYSPTTRNEYIEEVNYVKANNILSSIEKLNIEAEENFSIKGKFRAINCNSRYFICNSLQNEKYYGHFDKLLADGMHLINFVDIYEIKINRKTIKKAGKSDSQIVDTIEATYKIDDKIF